MSWPVTSPTVPSGSVTASWRSPGLPGRNSISPGTVLKTAPADREPLAAGELADLLQPLVRQRHFLRYTTGGLTDEQATQRTTVSELSLGGLIKHVALTEKWMRFIVEGPAAMSWDEASAGDWMAGFRMLDGATLADLLEAYAQVPRRTEELVMQLPDLDAAHPLPPAPGLSLGPAGRLAGCCCT